MKEYIGEHISETLSMKTLANLVHLSASRAAVIFKKAYRCTPHQYLLKLKMETAILLLQNTNLSVKEIALKVGYDDPHYFSNSFKQATSLSPTDFRNQNQ